MLDSAIPKTISFSSDTCDQKFGKFQKSSSTGFMKTASPMEEYDMRST